MKFFTPFIFLCIFCCFSCQKSIEVYESDKLIKKITNITINEEIFVRPSYILKYRLENNKLNGQIIMNDSSKGDFNSANKVKVMIDSNKSFKIEESVI